MVVVMVESKLTNQCHGKQGGDDIGRLHCGFMRMSSIEAMSHRIRSVSDAFVAKTQRDGEE